MPRAISSKAEIQQLLTELADRLAARGIAGRVYVVGGAALAITVYPPTHEREGTRDIDAGFGGPINNEREQLSTTTAEMAAEFGLSDDWFNDKAKFAIPVDQPPGIPLLERGDVRIETADHKVLLAMKLRASRTGRDEDDIALLVRRCDIRTNDEARTLYDRVYQGEETLSDKALQILNETRDAWLIETSSPPLQLDPIQPRNLDPAPAPPPSRILHSSERTSHCTGLNDDGSSCRALNVPGTDRCTSHAD